MKTDVKFSLPEERQQERNEYEVRMPSTRLERNSYDCSANRRGLTSETRDFHRRTSELRRCFIVNRAPVI